MSKEYFKDDYIKIQNSGRSPAFLETPEMNTVRKNSYNVQIELAKLLAKFHCYVPPTKIIRIKAHVFRKNELSL